MLATALVVGPIVGMVYGFVIAFNPFVYVNFIATFIAGGLTGMAVGKMSKPGRVRSLGACAVAGLVAGLGFEYTQWWATLYYYGVEIPLSEPGVIWSYVGELADLEPWTLMGVSIGATGFMALWSVEGLILVATPALLAMTEGSTPYCERCGTWVVEAEPIGPFDFVSDVERLTARVDRRDLDELKAFGRPEVTEDRYSTITLASCTGCQGLRLATVKNVEIEVERDGDEKRNESEILTHVVLDSATWDALSKL
jgi:hypothetical protein